MLLKADLHHMSMTGPIGKLHTEAHKFYLRHWHSTTACNSQTLWTVSTLWIVRRQQSYRLTAQTRCTASESPCFIYPIAWRRGKRNVLYVWSALMWLSVIRFGAVLNTVMNLQVLYRRIICCLDEGQSDNQGRFCTVVELVERSEAG